MRKSINLFAAAALLLGSAPLFADAQTDLTARYAALRAAMDEREDKPIKAQLTKDFHSTDLQGEVRDADDMIAALAMIPVGPEIKSETKLLSVAVDGTSAKVMQNTSMAMRRQGRDGAMHAGEFSTLAEDVWVQQGGKWLLKSSEAQEITIKRDGVEVRHFKKGDVIPPRGERGGRP
ncbi:MAG: DUF4440 domain-containing protein [Novosphingobium sp.]